MIAWRREKYIPKGGPAGGNGGNGGSIILRSSCQAHSLEYYRNHRIIKADHGQPGAGSNRNGKKGADLILTVPPGTLVKHAKTKEILFDFVSEGQEWTICKGGKGGKGNSHFKTPTHQAPYVSTPGTKGEAIEIEFELKLLADIGFVGMPNAGKSTLLSTLSHMPVKIAPYPFTTLTPNLSYLYLTGRPRILLADIPGIIVNAHKNRGLGLSFLKHVERTSALLFVIDISGFEGRDPMDDFLMLRNEILNYKPQLLEKPFLVALNQIDREGAQEQLESFIERYPFDKGDLYPISAKERSGITSLQEAIASAVQHAVTSPAPEETA